MHASIEFQWSTYKSRLSNWSTQSSVRAGKMHTYRAVDGTRSFSPELIAVMSHPVLQNACDATRRSVETQRLFDYLHFTEELERRAVIPVCMDLAEAKVPFLVSRPLQRDASKIITDEAHHAECAADLTDQIADVTCVRPHRQGPPAFMKKLHAAEARFGGATRKLASLVFTSVSETLITGTLTRVPADTSVHPAIRSVIMDHARDEAKHHACFSDVIRIMWEQMGLQERDDIGPLFAEFIVAFLAPDLSAELGCLEAAGFDSLQADKIITETYEAINLAAVYRDQAKPTLSMMQRYGMLDHQATLDGLAARNLV